MAKAFFKQLALLSFISFCLANDYVQDPATVAAIAGIADSHLVHDQLLPTLNPVASENTILHDKAVHKSGLFDTLWGNVLIFSGSGLIFTIIAFVFAHFRWNGDVSPNLSDKLTAAAETCFRQSLEEAKLCRAASLFVSGGAATALQSLVPAAAQTASTPKPSTAMPLPAVPAANKLPEIPPFTTKKEFSNTEQQQQRIMLMPPSAVSSPPLLNSGGFMPSTQYAPPPETNAVELKLLRDRSIELESQATRYKDTINRLLHEAEARESKFTELSRAEQAKDNELRNLERRYTDECGRASSAILELEDVRQRLAEQEASNNDMLKKFSMFETNKDDILRLNENTAMQALREYTSKNLDELRQLLDKTTNDLKRMQEKSENLEYEKLGLIEQVQRLESEILTQSADDDEDAEQQKQSHDEEKITLQREQQQSLHNLQLYKIEKEHLQREVATLKDRLSASEKQLELSKLLQHSEKKMNEIEKFKIELRETLLDEVRINHEREVDQYKYTTEALKNELHEKNRTFAESNRGIRMQCERFEIELMNGQNLIEELRSRIQLLQADNKKLRTAAKGAGLSSVSAFDDDDAADRSHADANVPVVYGGPHAHAFNSSNANISNNRSMLGGGFDFITGGGNSPLSGIGAAGVMPPQFSGIPPPSPGYPAMPPILPYGAPMPSFVHSPSGSIGMNEFTTNSLRRSEHHKQQQRRSHEPERNQQTGTMQSKRSTGRRQQEDKRGQSKFEQAENDDDDVHSGSVRSKENRKSQAVEEANVIRRRSEKPSTSKQQHQREPATVDDSKHQGRLRGSKSTAPAAAADNESNASGATAPSSKSGFGIRPLRIT